MANTTTTCFRLDKSTISMINDLLKISDWNKTEIVKTAISNLWLEVFNQPIWREILNQIEENEKK